MPVSDPRGSWRESRSAEPGWQGATKEYIGNRRGRSKQCILRGRLRTAARGEIAIAFSHGMSELAPGGQPDAALRAADEAMYRAKAAVAV